MRLTMGGMALTSPRGRARALALSGLSSGNAVVGSTVTAQENGEDATGVTWRIGGQTIAGETSAALSVVADWAGGELTAQVGNKTTAPADVTPQASAVQSMRRGTGSSFTTPPMVEGDMIVIFVRKGQTGTLVQGDCSLGTLQQANTNDDTHVNAMWTYKATAASNGMAVTTAGGNYLCLNIGAYDLNDSFSRTHQSGAGGSRAWGGGPDFPAGGGLAVYFASRRLVETGMQVLDPSDVQIPHTNPTLPATDFVVQDMPNNQWQLLVRAQATSGSIGGYKVSTPNSAAEHSFIWAGFVPATPGADNTRPGVYAADSNGKGRARTTTGTNFDVGSSGISFTLAEARPVGNYISGNDGVGDLFIVGACQVASYSPAFVDDDRKRHGAMLNPVALYTTASGFQQGFDEQDTNSPTYNESKRAAVPIDMVPGDVLVISRGQSGAVSGDNSKIAAYAVLTCVSSAPHSDAFRPPYVWPDGNRPEFRFSDLDMSLLPTYTAPLDFTEPFDADVSQVVDRFLFDPVTLWERYGLEAHEKTYSRDLQLQERDGLTVLALDRPFSVKRAPLIAMVQRGIDCYGVFTDARDKDANIQPWEKDGGHNASRGSLIVLAGKLLGNTDMTGVRSAFHELDQLEYITQAAIDYTNDVGWSHSAPNEEPYQQGMLDGQSLAYPMPEYVGDASDDGVGRWNAVWDRGIAQYYRTTGNASTWQAEALLLAAVAKTEWNAVNPALSNSALFFDYTARHWGIEANGVDPWILAGGGTARYTMVSETSAATGIDEWWQQVFDSNYVGGAYAYPWS